MSSSSWNLSWPSFYLHRSDSMKKIKNYPLTLYEIVVSSFGCLATKNYDFLIVGMPLAALTFLYERWAYKIGQKYVDRKV